MKRFLLYIQLAKPGIIFGNALTATAGFFLASKNHIDISLFISMLFGISIVIASACAFNNFIDRNLDKKMARTKNRALPQNAISEQNALVFATIVGIFGFSLLILKTNLVAAFMALIGYVVYIVFYAIMKRRSSHATLIGSIAGAMPPVVGYCAVSHRVDLAAALLFLIVALWQMPHFYAIAMYRLEDYRAASIPVLPVSQGIVATKRQMFLYTVAFVIASLTLSLLGYTGFIYFCVMAVLGLYWIMLCFRGFSCLNDTLWAKKMFFCSLVAVMVQCSLIVTCS